MTTSTFSLAMSPAPGWRNVRHVRNPERGIAVHGAVHDVDRIRAQRRIDEAAGRALPSLDLVLPHRIDEIVLLGGIELGKAAPAMALLAGALDRAQRRPIEIRVRRPHVHDA